MNKKRRIIIGISVFVAIIFIVGLLLIRHFYYYERKIMANSVLMIESLSEQQRKKMILYPYTHFGLVNEQTPQPTESEEKINLTDDQKNMIRSLIDGKEWHPYRRLWYRFDAIIKCDNDREYMLDMKNGIIFIEALNGDDKHLYGVDGDDVDVGWKIRSCIVLSETELETLKEALQGTGI